MKPKTLHSQSPSKPRKPPHLQGAMIYFDHNATSPLHPSAREAWLAAVEQFPGNPSSPHRFGSRAANALQRAREQLARILNCHPLDILWTSGATEANNLALFHFGQTLPSNAEVWISSVEHPCLLAPSKRHLGTRVRFIPVQRNGQVDLHWISTRLHKKPPSLIALMAANNETGVIQPWQELLKLTAPYEIPVFCDAVQWLGRMPSHALGQCDWISGCAHKFGGPRGTGFLKCAPNTKLHGQIIGGEQEDGRRAGTENVAGVMAMMGVLCTREEEMKKVLTEEKTQERERIEQRLLQLLPGSKLIGKSAPRLWNTIAMLMPQTDCQQRWVVKLDKAGFAVSTGSACSSGKEKASHVITAMGYTPSEAGRMIRISSQWETSPNDWNALIEAMAKINAVL